MSRNKGRVVNGMSLQYLHTDILKSKDNLRQFCPISTRHFLFWIRLIFTSKVKIQETVKREDFAFNNYVTKIRAGTSRNTYRRSCFIKSVHFYSHAFQVMKAKVASAQTLSEQNWVETKNRLLIIIRNISSDSLLLQTSVSRQGVGGSNPVLKKSLTFRSYPYVRY